MVGVPLRFRYAGVLPLLLAAVGSTIGTCVQSTMPTAFSKAWSLFANMRQTFSLASMPFLGMRIMCPRLSLMPPPRGARSPPPCSRNAQILVDSVHGEVGAHSQQERHQQLVHIHTAPSYVDGLEKHFMKLIL